MNHQVKELVSNELRACYDRLGIVAGKHHYNDYWTRDAYFGWLGALELGDSIIVKTHLENLIKFQKTNGFVPFMVRQTLPGLAFLGIQKRIKPFPKFKSHKVLFTSDVIDSNAYFILGVSDYLNKTNDLNFVNKYKDNIIKALNWYMSKKNKEGLISEGLIAQWNDGIYKRGAVLITNVQVYHATLKLAEILGTIGTDNKNYLEQAKHLKKNILNNFWNEKYLLDWICDRKKHNFVDSIANLLAIIWELVDSEQATKILEKIEKDLYVSPLIKTCYPQYPSNYVDIVNKSFGVGGYWQGKNIYWIEPGLLYVWALHKQNYMDKAKKVFRDIEKLIQIHNGVFETYKRTADSFEPLKSFFYQAENPYARGAGLYIHINSILE